MSIFRCSFIFRLAVASSADDDDLQLLQTRISSQYPCGDQYPCPLEPGDLEWTMAGLDTSAGENKCLKLVQPGGWLDWDCNGLEGRKAAVPFFCSTNSAGISQRAVRETCCKDECAALALGQPPTTTGWTQADLETSAGESKCLNSENPGMWGNYDCNGLEGRKAVVPFYCTYRNAAYRRGVPENCCKDECTALAAAQATTTPATTTPATTTPATTTPATTTPATTTPATTTPGSTQTTTTIPGGNTNPGGADCFGAIATFGPDFECNSKVSSFCGHDSADGLDVSACCQDYCNSNREKRTKRRESEREEKAAEGIRKSDRRESNSKRKDAESSRKKNKKEEEWLSKRGAQETSNKNAEDERKTKSGFSESKRKNERSWKANRQASKSKAQRREAERKTERTRKARNTGSAENKKKRRAAGKETVSKSEKAKKETRQKRKGRKGSR